MEVPYTDDEYSRSGRTMVGVSSCFDVYGAYLMNARVWFAEAAISDVHMFVPVYRSLHVLHFFA